jgi:hypothetical protein
LQLRTRSGGVRDGRDVFLRQYLHFGTSKASKLTTFRALSRRCDEREREREREREAALCAARYSVYLLYWYKRTNTDAEGAAEREHEL